MNTITTHLSLNYFTMKLSVQLSTSLLTLTHVTTLAHFYMEIRVVPNVHESSRRFYNIPQKQDNDWFAKSGWALLLTNTVAQTRAYTHTDNRLALPSTHAHLQTMDLLLLDQVILTPLKLLKDILTLNLTFNLQNDNIYFE